MQNEIDDGGPAFGCACAGLKITMPESVSSAMMEEALRSVRAMKPSDNFCLREGFDVRLICGGLSVRDYFAAAALQAILASNFNVQVAAKSEWDCTFNFSVLAYGFADAMIKARKARSEKPHAD